MRGLVYPALRRQVVAIRLVITIFEEATFGFALEVVSLRITLAHSADFLNSSFIIILVIFFFKLIASPEANVNPAIITGVHDCFANQTLGSTGRFEINF